MYQRAYRFFNEKFCMFKHIKQW